MDARVLLVTARLQRIECRALLAIAVGEVDGGGDGTVIELQKHTAKGRVLPDAKNGRSLFNGLRRLQLAHYILKRSPQSGSTQQPWARFLSRGVRVWRARLACASVTAKWKWTCSEIWVPFVFLTREVWSVMP